ncbi:hypothetical protein AB1E18_015740 [Capra hircus]
MDNAGELPTEKGGETGESEETTAAPGGPRVTDTDGIPEETDGALMHLLHPSVPVSSSSLNYLFPLKHLKYFAGEESEAVALLSMSPMESLSQWKLLEDAEFRSSS